MINSLLHFFEQYPQLAAASSICISIIVAVAGILPSVFVTAANILFFGFWEGTLVSFIGEAAGAAIAFLLYRKGFRKKVQAGAGRYPKVKRLMEATGTEAFYLVFSLRLLPFVPSGLVTFAAAVGKIKSGLFIAASSLGKIPALLIEAYSVYEVTQFTWLGKWILLLTGAGIFYVLLRRRRNKAA